MLEQIKRYFQWNFLKRQPAKTIKINSEQYTIRKIRTRDIRKLLIIERAVYAGDVPWDATAFFTELHSPFSHCYLLVVHNEKTIAFVGSRIEKKDCHVTNIAVLPDYQNLGVGRQLIEEIKVYAEKNKCTTLSLEVRIGNKDAQRFYRSIGFVSKSVKKAYYQDDFEDALDMMFLLEGK